MPEPKPKTFVRKYPMQIPLPVYERVQEQARLSGESAASWIRQAIREKLARDEEAR